MWTSIILCEVDLEGSLHMTMGRNANCVFMFESFQKLSILVMNHTGQHTQH